jgi:hypothetical protein
MWHSKKIKLIFINLLILILGLGILIIGLFFYSKHQINAFFNIKTANHSMYLQKDSLALFIHKPNIAIYENWGTTEQKFSGKRRTNNLGFREDKDIVEKKANEYRILITGDSHTEGSVKNNEDTFINVLEKNLNTGQNSRFYNSINAGCAYYTFRNYAGILKKYLYLKPDVFLINVFIGNDFRETILFEDDRTRLENVYKYTYYKTVRKFFSTEKKSELHNQGVEQTLYFYNFEQDIETSLNLSKFYLEDIIATCKKNNIKLIVTLLPSKIETNLAYKKSIKSIYDLSENTVNINKKLSLAFQAFLKEKNVTHFNLLNPLKQAKEKMYWDHDKHINDKAHTVIGNYLYEHLNLN